MTLNQAVKPKIKAVPTVYIVRHEPTALNDGKEKRLRGWKDEPIDARGEQDLVKLANFFTAHRVVHVVTADLQRHFATGHAIAKKHGATLTPSFSFRPWDNTEAWGDRPIDKKLIAEMQTYIDAPDKVVPNGESFRTMYDRNVNGLQSIFDHVIAHPDEPTAIVTSTRGIGAFLHYLYGDKTHIVGKDAINPGGVIELTYDGKTWNAKVLRKDTGFFQPKENKDNK